MHSRLFRQEHMHSHLFRQGHMHSHLFRQGSLDKLSKIKYIDNTDSTRICSIHQEKSLNKKNH